MTNRNPKLRGILFDMDGTIVDVPYDWTKIRAELKTQGKPVLSYLESLSEPEKTHKWKILEEYEDKATSNASMKKGMKTLFSFLKEKSVKTALITNNSEKNISFLMEKFHLSFDVVMTRETGVWKPSGEPFLLAVKKMGVNREECCVVGDSYFDVLAAKAARISRIFIFAPEEQRPEFLEAFIVHSAEELRHQIDKWV